MEVSDSYSQASYAEAFALLSTKIVTSGLSTRRSISGCSDSEIRRVETAFDLSLPLAYKMFLKEMGHGAGRFMQGTDMFFDHLFENRAAAEEALEHGGYPFDLRKEMFVFSSHQGYIFHLFDCDTHIQNPPIFGFEEGETRLTKVGNSFTEFLSGILDEEIESWNHSREI